MDEIEGISIEEYNFYNEGSKSSRATALIITTKNRKHATMIKVYSIKIQREIIHNLISLDKYKLSQSFVVYATKKLNYEKFYGDMKLPNQ